MHLLRLDYRQPAPLDVELPYEGTIAAASGGSELLRDASFGHAAGLTADPRNEGALFSLESWTHPRSWLRFDMHVHRVEDAQVVPAHAPLAAYQTIETYAVARDGARIPISLIARRDMARDGARPTVLEAYGSYGYAYDPHFLPAAMAWADQGGVYAIAHVRGGGELGPPWHEAGQFARKRNTITDFLTCADTLVAQGYSTHAHIGALGVNAGAVAAGGAVTWQPGALRAAVFRDGLLNPLRAIDGGPPEELVEFGSPHNAAQFADLLPIDAYSQIREGTAYPAVLLTGHEGDAAAQTWQSAKMAARLGEASTSGRPVLLRLSGAHAVAAEADELAFLWWQLSK
jgi:prolyl oligopeptidase